MHGSPYTFSVKPKWRTRLFSGFSRCASRLKRCVFVHVAPRGHSTVEFQSDVKVLWRFGCVHARTSRSTVFSSPRLRRASTAMANRYNDIPTMAFQWWRFHNINSGRYHYAGTMHASSPCFWDGESNAIHTRYRIYQEEFANNRLLREIVISP